jgi:3alpha(or 20beta)-hydroxysteroid dehydrogenase
MKNSLKDQVILVTGAARGMGAQHVRELVEVGARVIATDILDGEGEALAAELGDQVVYAHHDVTNEAEWQKVVALAESSFGPINHLVNNAGIVSYGSIETQSPDDFRRVIDINLTGCWLGMHFCLPSLKRAAAASGGGSIVNISSTAGLQGYANIGAYVASKWGLRGLTKTAALELGPFGIRANLIHPGPIRTPMTDGLKDVAVAQPIARLGEPAEVSAMLLFLLADATYSTGHEFIIDGGAVVGQILNTPEN